MVTGAQGCRLLLRAEVHSVGEPIVCHTLEMSETQAFLETARLPPIAQVIELRLSFPRLIEPFSIAARVTSYRPSRGPGEPAGVVVDFVYRSEDERKRVAALLARVSDKAETAAVAGASFRVLLVEDNALICDMFAYGVRKFFKTRGGSVSVDVAQNGEDAWKKLQHGLYDFAIVDIYLPVLPGDQLIKRMRADADLRNIPVVAISVGGASAREMSLAAGADLFLDKPIVLRDLFATLNRLTQPSAP